MSETKQAWEPVPNRFPTFQNQEEAAAAGAPGARDYRPDWDQQYFFDPAPVRAGTARGVPYAKYLVFSGNVDATGNGIIEETAVPLEQAARVNIKPSGVGQTNVPGTGVITPTPINPLASTQVIRRMPRSTFFRVRNLDVPESAAELPLEEVNRETLRLVRDIDARLAVKGI